jgi:hypothetical protein
MSIERFAGITLRVWFHVGAILALILVMHSDVWIPSHDRAQNEIRRPRADLMLFYAGALLLREAPEKLYDVDRQAEAQRQATGLSMDAGDVDFLPYLYPPIVGLAFVPFTFVSYRVAYVATMVLNLVLLGVSLSYLSVSLQLNRRATQVLILATTASVAVYATLVQGQVSFWFLLLYVLIIINLREGNHDRAGMWAGFLAFKVQLLPVWLVWFAIRRRWNALGYALAVAGTIAAVSVLLVGVGGSLSYLNLSRQIMAGKFYSALPNDMPNLRGLTYFFGLGDAVWLAAFAGVLLALYKIPRSSDWEYCAIVIAAILTAPYIQMSESVLLLIVVALILAQQREQISVWMRWCLFGLMLWQSVARWLFAGPNGNHWPAMPVTFIGLFFYVAYRSCRRDESPVAAH